MVWTRFTAAISLLPVFGVLVQGQTFIGYGPNTPLVRVAPGHLITLFADLKGILVEKPLRADDLPLPKRIGGFGAFANFNSNTAEALPVFAVRQTSEGKVAVTVQVPFYEENLWPASIGVLHPNGSFSRCGPLGPCEFPQAIARVKSALHILTTCDSVFAEPTTSRCDPLVTHPNGTLVRSNSLPRSGEVLVAYAVGLGRPPTFDDAKPFNVLDDVVVSQTDCPQTFRRPPDPGSPLADFAALLQPSVGIYQINFRVTAPESESQCNGFFGPEITIGRVIDGVSDSFDVIQLPPLAP